MTFRACRAVVFECFEARNSQDRAAKIVKIGLRNRLGDKARLTVLEVFCTVFDDTETLLKTKENHITLYINNIRINQENNEKPP